MHMAAATRQGGLMTRSTISEQFGAWLRPRLEAAGMSQTDLRRRLEALGVETGKQTVSQWVNGANTPMPDTIVVIAEILKAPPADALRNAGHVRVAALVAEGAPSQPADPVIEAILNDPKLPADFKQRAIDRYRRRVAIAAEETRELTDLVREPDLTT